MQRRLVGNWIEDNTYGIILNGDETGLENPALSNKSAAIKTSSKLIPANTTSRFQPRDERVINTRGFQSLLISEMENHKSRLGVGLGEMF